MNNAEVCEELDALRQQVDTKCITIEDVERAFERLTYQLGDVTRDDARALHQMVNEIETIRFTQRAETQLPAVADVLRRAARVFDHAP